MVALKMQQVQYNLKKNFLRRLWRLVIPMLFGGSDGSPRRGGGGLQEGGGDKHLLLSMTLLHMGAGCRVRGQLCLPLPLSALPVPCKGGGGISKGVYT